MAVYSDEIIAAMKVVGAAAWQADMEKSAASTQALGTASQEAGAKAETAGRGFGASAGHFLKYAAGITIAYKAAHFLKESVQNTAQLAVATNRLRTITGFDVETGSAWLSMAKERGIQNQMLIRSFVQLGKAQEAAATGTGKQQQAFAYLGISADELRQKKPAQLMGEIANGFSQIQNPALKASEAQKLFGRAGQQMIPFINQGSAAMDEQLKHVQALGGSLDANGSKKAIDFARQMRSLNAAMAGVQIQIGLALMPAILTFTKAITGLLKYLQPLFRLLGRYPGVLTAVAAGITAAYIAQRLWNLAMAENPIGAVVFAAVLLGFALVELYKKNETFRHAVQATWRWIKDNWPLLVSVLLGPFGIATALIIKNFGRIKRAFHDLYSAVRHPLGTLEHLGGSLISHIPGLQEGGRVTQSGLALVGERGPEVLHLPSGAQVTPLSATAGQVVVPVYLDGREIARAIGQFNADRKARR